MADQGETSGFQTWMTNLAAHLHRVPLSSLAIPGAHNAGTCRLEKSWGLSPDADGGLKSLAVLPVIGPMATDIAARWSKTQSLTIAELLQAGVRYLDLRVARGGLGDDLHLVHSLFGPKVWDAIEDVCAFLEKNPREVVLLDFNHFYNMEAEHHLQLITFLVCRLQGSLCPACPADQMALADLWERRQQAIVFYQHDLGRQFAELWPAASIASPWANTTSVDVCLEYQEKAARQERTPGHFQVCQLVLTPDMSFILQRVADDLLHACAEKINPRIPCWLQSSSLQGHAGCIFALDFVEMGQVIDSIIKLNV